MKYDFTYEWVKKDLEDYIDVLEEVDDTSARQWIFDTDDSSLAEGERLNFMLAVIKWEVERGCISEPVEDELYLYYEQLTKGELDSIIDPEEREKVVKDLTDCFNKVFPEGLID